MLKVVYQGGHKMRYTNFFIGVDHNNDPQGTIFESLTWAPQMISNELKTGSPLQEPSLNLPKLFKWAQNEVPP